VVAILGGHTAPEEIFCKSLFLETRKWIIFLIHQILHVLFLSLFVVLNF
jgi:hypothetical protein